MDLAAVVALWTETLDPAAKYERGFLASGQLVADRTPIELPTFRELTVGHAVPDLDHPVFRGIAAWPGVARRRHLRPR